MRIIEFIITLPVTVKLIWVAKRKDPFKVARYNFLQRFAMVSFRNPVENEPIDKKLFRDECVNLVINGEFIKWLKNLTTEQVNETFKLARTENEIAAGKIAATVMDEIIKRIEHEAKAYYAENAEEEIPFEEQQRVL